MRGLPDDPANDFERRTITLLEQSKTVLIAGTGPAVIVMAEMPGISPEVLRFARWVRDAGFTVWLPNLFGKPGRAVSTSYTAHSLTKACISREFRAFAANQESPVLHWLRALAAHAHQQCGGPGVGAIGMCFTGNFALSMMLEPAVLAPVLSQPSLPLANKAGLHIAPSDLVTIKKRLDSEDLTVLGYRFDGDRFCRKERFAAYREALGDRFIATELPDSAAHPSRNTLGNPHSVVTLHLIDRAGEPTRQAVDDIIAFFAQRLGRAI